MSNMLDYIRWRGDLSFSQDPLNSIDALIFSTLCYFRFSGTLLEKPEQPISLKEAADEFFSLDDFEKRAREKNDLELFRIAAESKRFGMTKVCRYRDSFIPLQDTQFAAVTFLMDNEFLFLAFRGTDNTLVGWKEDFSMCFQQTIPAQRLALQYVREIYAEYSSKMYLGGHSKGGNLAVFAAARSSPIVQESILSVYNNDGPGFSDYMMGDPGYLAMVSKIHTYVPQSSLIGMIMDHEEAYTIVKSDQVSILQHNPLSWEVMGNDFLKMDQLTGDSRFFNRTIKNWLAGMNHDERNQMVDVLFELLSTGTIDEAGDIFQIKNVLTYLKMIGNNETFRKVLSDDFIGLLEAARKARHEMDIPKIEQ